MRFQETLVTGTVPLSFSQFPGASLKEGWQQQFRSCRLHDLQIIFS
jgi:hypothetical protein